MSALEPQVATFALLADPIRWALYRFVAAAEGDVGRDEAAREVGASRTAVAYHLDRLVREGLLEADFRRLSGRQGPGAGRTAKVYRRSDREIDLTVPPRHYRRVGQIMAEALERLPTETRSPVLAGAARHEGERLAAAEMERGGGLPTLLASLSRNGYQPVATDGEVRLRNCPFHLLAQQHRELVCGINVELIGALKDNLAFGEFEAVYDPRPGWCCVVITRIQA
ncbi:MAG TPA: transcriptional regulator [Acidimicrobiia bacterium]|nr:transcriptional regulator [Acidimicrobiia bacterium]